MADKVKGRAIPRRATTFLQMRSSLQDDEWAVHSTDPIIISQIYEHLSRDASADNIEGTITYKRRKVPVFFVPFVVVEFLKNNKHNRPNYISFHRKKRAFSGSDTQYGLWSAWREGKNSPNTFLKDVFKNWKRV